MRLTGLTCPDGFVNPQYVATSVDTTGMEFTAEYSDGTTDVVSPQSHIPTTWGDTVGTQTCTFSYTEDEVTVTCVVDADVEAAPGELTVTSISISGTPTNAPQLGHYVDWTGCTFTYGLSDGTTLVLQGNAGAYDESTDKALVIETGDGLSDNHQWADLSETLVTATVNDYDDEGNWWTANGYAVASPAPSTTFDFAPARFTITGEWLKPQLVNQPVTSTSQSKQTNSAYGLTFAYDGVELTSQQFRAMIIGMLPQDYTWQTSGENKTLTFEYNGETATTPPATVYRTWDDAPVGSLPVQEDFSTQIGVPISWQNLFSNCVSAEDETNFVGFMVDENNNDAPISVSAGDVVDYIMTKTQYESGTATIGDFITNDWADVKTQIGLDNTDGYGVLTTYRGQTENSGYRYYWYLTGDGTATSDIELVRVLGRVKSGVADNTSIAALSPSDFDELGIENAQYYPSSASMSIGVAQSKTFTEPYYDGETITDYDTILAAAEPTEEGYVALLFDDLTATAVTAADISGWKSDYGITSYTIDTTTDPQSVKCTLDGTGTAQTSKSFYLVVGELMGDPIDPSDGYNVSNLDSALDPTDPDLTETEVIDNLAGNYEIYKVTITS